MKQYRVTLEFPDDRCARGIVVEAPDVQRAEVAAVDDWDQRKYTEHPGPVASYSVSKIERKKHRLFGRARWVLEATQ